MKSYGETKRKATKLLHKILYASIVVQAAHHILRTKLTLYLTVLETKS